MRAMVSPMRAVLESVAGVIGVLVLHVAGLMRPLFPMGPTAPRGPALIECKGFR